MPERAREAGGGARRGRSRAVLCPAPLAAACPVPLAAAFAVLAAVAVLPDAVAVRPAAAQPGPPATPGGDVARTAELHRLRSAVLPPDGILLIGLGGELYGIDYVLEDGRIDQASLQNARLSLAYGPWPGVRLDADVTRRFWSDPAGRLPASGGGWSALRGGVEVALPAPSPAIAWAVHGGTTLPLGPVEEGAAEDGPALSAGASVTARLWRQSRYPEMRLHLGAGWRGNPDAGRGAAGAALVPWPPLYPAAPAGHGGDNDERFWGGAVEMRRGLVSLFVEYTETRLPRRSGVASGECARFLTSGLHWGGAEGWGLSVAYDVNLALDDSTTAFVPAYPDLVFHVSLSRALALGGRDRDHDGVPDRRDACPDAPEDHDGWQDGDGCPDPDNDGDGVLDVADGAPNEPEDRDGFEDEDGVPDPDNDGDGILDAQDACPDAPEDFDGDRDEDGCPEEFVDSDGDGIRDDRDHCPTTAEDLDGFEDDDGCPDPDNDLDGIDDARDQCPNEPEDYDGDRDDDGCPDVAAAGGG